MSFTGDMEGKRPRNKGFMSDADYLPLVNPNRDRDRLKGGIFYPLITKIDHFVHKIESFIHDQLTDLAYIYISAFFTREYYVIRIINRGGLYP